MENRIYITWNVQGEVILSRERARELIIITPEDAFGLARDILDCAINAALAVAANRKGGGD